MNADTASPTTPAAPAPVGGPQPPVPQPGATTPPDQQPHTPTEPNALLEWSKKAWENIKAGKVGDPRILALILAVVAIGAAWWFLARSSKQADSALWFKFDEVVTAEQAKKFAEEPTNATTQAAKIANLNNLRLRKDAALRYLTAPSYTVREKAASDLEALRGNFAEAAGGFDKDRTLKAQAFLAAAEIEMGLIGVPKKGVATMGADVKGNCRGQVAKYAEYLRSAADAIGKETEIGQKFLADADKVTKEPEASDLYRRLGTFHANFNNPDPIDPSKAPFDPNAPKTPDSIPGGTGPKPGDTATPGDLPKPPVDPFKDEKK